MDALPAMAQIAGAVALLVAAAAKAATPGRVTATLAALGFPRPATRGLAWALVATEVAAAVALASAPAAPGSRALVVALGTTFALAGLHARRQGITVACNCFGGRSRHPLGLGQAAAWPLWIAVAALAPGSDLTGGDGLAGLAAVTVVAAVALAAPVLITVIRTRRHLPAPAPIGTNVPRAIGT